MAHVVKILRGILFHFRWKCYGKFVMKLMSTLSLFLVYILLAANFMNLPHTDIFAILEWYKDL